MSNKIFKRINYLSKLIFYLKESRDLFRTELLSLRSVYNYLKKILNEKSATDNSSLLQLENVINKLDYASMYYDVCIDFYEDK